MGRVHLPNGKWFDPEKAIEFSESTCWNGNNHISVNTGSQWIHETLYHTKSGVWVLYHSSQWQGSLPSWEIIGLDTAATWLIVNEEINSDGFNLLPAEVQESIKATMESLEV